MPSIQKKKVYQDFSKGLNDRLSAIKISEDEATEILNCVLNDRGILEKYKGFIKDGSPFPNDPDSFIRFLLNFKRGTSVDVLLMAALDDANVHATLKVDLKKTSGDGLYTTIAAGIFHKDFVPRGIVFNNFAIITNGSEEVKKYDNTTLSGIAAAPRGRYIESHKNRVFIASTSSAPSTIFWSAVNDETVWDAAAFEPVYPQDNGNIISIKSFADSLIVLKNNGNIYQVVGSFDQDAVGSPNFIRRIDAYENIGIISERTPVIHNGLLYFMAETGLYSLDRSMGISKVTFNLVNFIKSLNFSLGPTTSKTFTFDTDAEWTTGSTLEGTRVTDGKLKNYFDSLTISNVKQAYGRCSVAIDTSNNVHLAYVDSNDNTLLKYVKWLASDNTSVTETAADESFPIHEVSIDVAPNGNVGIAYQTEIDADANFRPRYVERTASWGSIENISTAFTKSLINGKLYGTTSLRFTSGNEARVAWYRSGAGYLYSRRESAVWGTPQDAATGGSWPHLSLELNGSNNPRVSGYNFSGNELLLNKSDTNGNSGTWSVLDTIVFGGSGSFSDADHLQLDLNSTSQPITVFSDNSFTVKKRNHSTATTTVIFATDGRARGYQVYSDTDAGADLDYTYRSGSIGPNGDEGYRFESSPTLFNPTSGTINGILKPGDRAMHNNGRVFATAVFGSNANEIIVRRISFRGEWISPNKNDLTFATWGTYETTGVFANGATVTQEIKTNATEAGLIAAPYRSISNGQIIGPNTEPWVSNKITFVLGTFASPEIDSIVDNFTGAGVDAKQMVGISFDNELFYAVSFISDLSNSITLVQDIADVYTKVEYPVSSFERFKGKLYAGRSTNGDLLILKQGYNFAGSSYSSDIQLKEDFLETIELDKDLFKIYVLFEVKDTGTFDFSYRLDSFKSSGGSTWVTTSVDQTKDGVAEIRIGNKARTIQMRVENSGLDQQLGIVAAVLVFGDLNIR